MKFSEILSAYAQKIIGFLISSVPYNLRGNQRRIVYLGCVGMHKASVTYTLEKSQNSFHFHFHILRDYMLY